MVYWRSDDGRVVLHCGDAREIVPQLGHFDCVITDPVWPNALPDLAGADDPQELFAVVAQHLPARAHRLVVHLGCDSDPRFLNAVPAEMPFLRVCWLEYVQPHYKGRLLYTSDVAYVFGKPPRSKPGAHVLPGRFIQTDAAKVPEGHPCPRQLQHVAWLLRWFAEGPVLDPFAGSGTTLVAAVRAGLPAVGIEIEERYCEVAARRLEAECRQLRLAFG